MKELIVSGDIKTLDELLFMCQYFDVIEANDEVITFSGEVNVVGDWKMITVGGER